MKRTWKIIGALAGVAVLLVVVLAVLVNTMITPEKIKERVIPLAQQALQREVQLENVDVSLFSGIVLKNLVVKERSGETVFVSADRVVLRYQFWPLLFLRVVVDEVRLDSPKITVIRLSDGSFNFSDLIAPATASSEAAPAAASDGSVTNRSLDLLVANIAIADGELQFIDQEINPTAPYLYRISSLQMDAKNISLEQEFPFEVSAKINGSLLNIVGGVDLSKKSGKAQCQLGDFDITALSPYFRDQLPGKLRALKLNLDLSVEGGSEVLATRGKIAFQRIDIALDALPNMPVKDVSLSLDYDVRVDLTRSVVQIAQSSVNMNGILLEVSGQVANYAVSPEVNLKVSLNELNLRTALAALPKELVGQAEQFDPAGTIRARLNLEGPIDKPLALLRSGEVELSGIQASAGGLRPALNGFLSVAGDRISAEKLKLALGDNVADITFTAANIFSKPIVLSSLVTSERFLLDPLLKATAAPATGSETAPAATRPTEEIGPFDLPIKADGEMHIDQAVYQGLTIDDFMLRYRLVDNLLTIETMTGKMAGGTFSKTASVDLGKKGLNYTGKVNLAGVQAEPMVKAFAPKAAGTIFGGLSLEADFSGKGTLPEAIRSNLSGKGSLDIIDGRLTGSSLMQGLADFVHLDDLREVRFQRAHGNYTMQDGKVLLESTFSGKDVSMTPNGTIGLNGNLDLNLGTRLAPVLMAKLDRKGEVAQLFVDQQGWGELPLRVVGNLSSPKFSFDSAALKAQAKGKAQSELHKKLDDKLFKSNKVDPQLQEPAKQMIDDALKGLFGK